MTKEQLAEQYAEGKSSSSVFQEAQKKAINNNLKRQNNKES